MNTRRTLLALAALCAAASTHAQLTLNQIGGSLAPGNLSTLPTTSAFGKDEIGGGSLPIHKIPNIRDGIYGNSNSWIGDSPNSFIGLNFGAAPVAVGRISWGRDNTHTYFDRTAGVYTLQFTTVPNPGAGTPDASWTTIGAVNYEFQGADSLISMSQRHLWSFPSVNATGLRLITPGSSFADGTDIDELEAYAFAPAPLTLATVGGSMSAGNIALASAGSVAFGKDELNYFNGVENIHVIVDINDGLYGNSNSWIGNSEGSFVGVRFAAAQTIDRVAFGRENTGAFNDRDSGNYRIQYTTVPGANAATPDASWTDIGAVYYDPADPSAHLRHEYSFAPVVGATALRIVAPGNGIGTGRAIDELEVYQAVPEPGSVTLIAAAAGLLIARRRRICAR